MIFMINNKFNNYLYELVDILDYRKYKIDITYFNESNYV